MNVLTLKSQNRQRVLNPRVAVIVAIVLTVLVYGTRKLHDRQFGKTVDFLRSTANSGKTIVVENDGSITIK